MGLRKGGFINLLPILRHWFIRGSKGLLYSHETSVLFTSSLTFVSRILDSELLKCFCVMLACSYVMGAPDSATCSVLLLREVVVKGLLPRDETTSVFINEFSVLQEAAEEK